MVEPTAKKLPIDESNISRLTYKAETRMKELGWVDTDVAQHRGYILNVSRDKILPLLDTVIREAYAHGAASHDISIDMA